MLSPTCSLAKFVQLLSFKRSKCKMCKLLVVKCRGEKIAIDTRFYDWSYFALALVCFCPKMPLTNVQCLTFFPINTQLTLSRGKVNMLTAPYLLFSCSWGAFLDNSKVIH